MIVRNVSIGQNRQILLPVTVIGCRNPHPPDNDDHKQQNKNTSGYGRRFGRKRKAAVTERAKRPARPVLNHSPGRFE